LHLAAKEGNVEVLEALYLDSELSALDMKTKDGMNVLAIAAKHGKTEFMKKLSSLQVWKKLVTEFDCSGRTALHWAACNGSVDPVVILIKSGSHINAQDSDGNTAL
jgi:ankyrin repeat protein